MRKELVKPKTSAFTMKLTPEELAKFKKTARTYANGNVSALIRHAVLNFRPNKSEE